MKTVKERKEKAVKSNTDESVLHMYLNEISRIPLLTREEEDSAARAAARGNSAARNKLINSNLRFVITVARKYQKMGIPLPDLINEGNIGLIKAVEKFDVNRGYHFISYAVWWIRQSILKALYEKAKLIRLPANHANNLIHIKKTRDMLSGDTENQIQEIAHMLNVKEHYVEDIMAISREVVSLEKMVHAGAGVASLGNFVADNRYDDPEQAVMKKSLEHDIEELLDTLDSKEAEVIRLHYGLGERIPMSLSEIGDQFNLTKERIRQIEEKALVRLRHISRRDKLAAYVA